MVRSLLSLTRTALENWVDACSSKQLPKVASGAHDILSHSGLGNSEPFCNIRILEAFPLPEKPKCHHVAFALREVCQRVGQYSSELIIVLLGQRIVFHVF